MKDPRTLAEQLSAALERVLGPRLHAVTLFGSAARGEWLEGVSDVNVLVLLENIDARLLDEIAPAAKPSLARGVVPLLMELGEWRSGHDVFPIELADMKDAGVVLLGEDPAAAFVVEKGALRLQAERELRAKLIHLHAGMLVAAGDRRRLGTLLVKALPSFTTYLRTALRLSGQPVPGTSADVIAEGSRLTGGDPAPFLDVLAARRSGGKLEVSLEDPLADQFNTAAERIAAFIDALGR